MEFNEQNITEICRKIETFGFVTSVQKVGSRAEGHADCYSDIDLVVNIRDIKPDIALLKITEFMKITYAPLWVDFANSLMPQKFVVSMFIDCENPFCFLDIGIYNEENFHYNPQTFQNDKWVHLTKLWIMNFKYYLRKDSRLPLRFEKMMKKAGISNWQHELDGFEKLLKVLSDQNTVSKSYIDKLHKVFRQETNAARDGKSV